MSKWTILIVLLATSAFVASGDEDALDAEIPNPAQDDDGQPELNQEKFEYAKGSLCSYCDYCKFCKLCDEDCPCERSDKKPNCHMCKYCKYCTFCSTLCDTVCQAGGILDRASAAIVNALPDFNTELNKDKVDEEIESVRHWIDKKKEEL